MRKVWIIVALVATLGLVVGGAGVAIAEEPNEEPINAPRLLQPARSLPPPPRTSATKRTKGTKGTKAAKATHPKAAKAAKARWGVTERSRRARRKPAWWPCRSAPPWT